MTLLEVFKATCLRLGAATQEHGAPNSFTIACLNSSMVTEAATFRLDPRAVGRAWRRFALTPHPLNIDGVGRVDVVYGISGRAHFYTQRCTA